MGGVQVDVDEVMQICVTIFLIKPMRSLLTMTP